MKLLEIEAWTLRIIDDVIHGRPNEDARVELKTEWPRSPEEAARQIAGHANAAGGSPILWVIGVNQKRGVEGAPHQELATWYPQVQKHFDGLAPRLIDLNVPFGEQTVVALLFETDRAPFVTRNPASGKSGGGPVEREVPWREGTGVRSARREELIRLLSPLQHLPHFEILGGRVRAHPHSQSDETMEWSLSFHIYVVPIDEGQLALPFHYCQALLLLSSGEELACSELKLSPITQTWLSNSTINSQSYSHTVMRSDTEVIVNGPGTIFLKAVTSTSDLAILPNELSVTLKLRTANSLGVASLSAILHRDEDQEAEARVNTPRLQGLWQMGAPL